MNTLTRFLPWARCSLALCLVFSLPVAHGELIGTDQLAVSPASRADADGPSAPGSATSGNSSSDKAAIQGFVSRADVQKKMQALGLSAVITAQRIALLNDEEARQLADKINALPAGGNLSNLSSTDIIILLLGAILLVLVV